MIMPGLKEYFLKNISNEKNGTMAFVFLCLVAVGTFANNMVNRFIDIQAKTTIQLERSNEVNRQLLDEIKEMREENSEEKKTIELMMKDYPNKEWVEDRFEDFDSKLDRIIEKLGK